MIPNVIVSADILQKKLALSDVWSDRAGFFCVCVKGVKAGNKQQDVVDWIKG